MKAYFCCAAGCTIYAAGAAKIKVESLLELISPSTTQKLLCDDMIVGLNGFLQQDNDNTSE